MSTKTAIYITGADTDAPLLNNRRPTFQYFSKLFTKLASGHKGVAYSVDLRASAGLSTGTVTLATCLAGTTIRINGCPFTAIASGTPDTTIGEFVISGTDAADATSLVAAINASTDTRILGVVTASSTGSTGVVTLTAVKPGYGGNGVEMKTQGVCAFATLTCVSAIETDTVVVGKTTLTIVASHATSSQIDLGASDAEMATNIAAKINSNATTSAIVRATSALGVVTVRALTPGLLGNCIGLSTTGGTITASTARLISGTVAGAEGVQASATITLSSADGGTYATIINGVTINATGTNGNTTTTAASIATAINASTDALVRGLVYAASTTNVVTVSAIRGGTAGNNITFTGTGTGTTFSGSGYLASGAAPLSVVPSAERMASGTETRTVFTA